MLDELLGRAELKERIAELEEENHHLERRAEAEEERRAEAARARQEAERRVNRLEDRVAELEDRVERRTDDEPELSFRDRTDLRGGRLREVLARLRSFETDSEGALTAMVEGDGVPSTVAEAVGNREALVRRAAPCLVCVDDARLVAVTLAPPQPPAPFVEWGAGFDLAGEWFHPTEGQWVALVRSDLFVLGRYTEGDWTVVDHHDSDVMNAHSKGGFSQGRFERRRDDQIAAHLEAALDTLDEHSPERLVCLGERTVLGEFEDRADVMARVDASGDPEPAFQSAVEEFFTTRLALL